MTGHAPITYAIGKKSGKETIRYFLNELKLVADESQVNAILENVKEFSIAHLRRLTLDEFEKIALENGAVAEN